MKILIVGSTPQTAGIGGVAIHVERLLDALKHRSVDVVHEDYKKSALRPFLKCITADVVHIHSQNKMYSFLLALFAELCHAKVVYTLHQKYVVGNSFECKFCNWLFMVCDIIITLNTQSKDDIRKILGIDTVLLPAFIPPTHTEPLNDDILNLIKRGKQCNRKLCVTNAAYYSVSSIGETYGISFLVKYFSKHPNCFLIVSDPSGQNKVNISCEADNIAFITYKHSFYEILKRADIFIRHTNTDGDALSVKESLSLGVCTLCTDVVDRPEEAILFKYENEESLSTALSKVNNADRKVSVFSNLVDDLIKLYGIN